MDLLHLEWRRYALAVAHRWPLVLITGIVFGALALAGSLVLLQTAPVYEAQSLILIAKPRLNFAYDKNITNPPNDLIQWGSTAALNNRLQSLATLARSNEVETAVAARLAERLDTSDRIPGHLAARIRVRPSNEFLRVTATASTPQFATELANAWSDEAATRMESLYNATGGVDSMESSVVAAQRELVVADRAATRFNIEHPIEDLSRRVQAKGDEIKGIQDQKTTYVRLRAASLYANLSQIDSLIRDAETLQTQFLEPTASQAAASGDALAVLMLRARGSFPREPIAQTGSGAGSDSKSGTTVTAGGNQLLTIQIAPDRLIDLGAGPASYAHDLDNTIRVLRTRRAELQAEFDDLGRQLRLGLESTITASDDPLDAALSQAVTELQVLRAELQELVRQRDELGVQRKVAEANYTTLMNKLQELRVARATSGGEGIMVAERAVPPLSPAAPRPLFNTAIALVLGLLVGCALALSAAHRGPTPALATAGSRGSTGSASEPTTAPALPRRP